MKPSLVKVFSMTVEGKKKFKRAGVKYSGGPSRTTGSFGHAVGAFDPFGTRGDVSFFPGAGGGGNGGAGGM